MDEDKKKFSFFFLWCHSFVCFGTSFIPFCAFFSIKNTPSWKLSKLDTWRLGKNGCVGMASLFRSMISSGSGFEFSGVGNLFTYEIFWATCVAMFWKKKHWALKNSVEFLQAPKDVLFDKKVVKLCWTRKGFALLTSTKSIRRNFCWRKASSKTITVGTFEAFKRVRRGTMH